MALARGGRRKAKAWTVGNIVGGLIGTAAGAAIGAGANACPKAVGTAGTLSARFP
jgi:hypothetical protein